MRRFFSVLSAVVEKDLRLEWRTKESLLIMVVFALLVLTLFSFAFGPWRREWRERPRRSGGNPLDIVPVRLRHRAVPHHGCGA